MSGIAFAISPARLAAAFFGLLLAGGIAAYEILQPAVADPTPASPSVLVTELRLSPGTMPVTFVAYGSIQPGPGGEATVAPPAGGILGSLAVTQGQHVAAGQVLATLTPDAASVADAEKAVSAVMAARSNFLHVSALLASHLATDADLAAAAQALRDAQATQAAIHATGSGAQRRLEAPFDGIVTAILVTPGTAFAAGIPILRIASEAVLMAAVGLPPDQASRISIGAAAKITMLDTGNILTATVTGTGAMLDPQTGLLPLQLAVPANALLDAPVRAVITAQTLPGYAVPRDAVRTDDTGDFVYQVDARNIAHRITVHILVRRSDQTLIAADIGTKMPVVVTGAAQLADGMAVRTAGMAGRTAATAVQTAGMAVQIAP